MLIYLDNCCFNRPFDNQSQLKIEVESKAKLLIQAKILNKEYELCWSYMLDYENSINPFTDRKNRISKWKQLSSVNCDKKNKAIIEISKGLLEKGLKIKDSVHVACAIYCKCEYFITTDMGILNKKVDDIKIVDPLEFIRRENL
ncbi:hypothetical protein CEB3_c31360 [Peptococcaceae bacterium CEB3]|nr:hypothetical protein CEB3_c31360 [Peptococcaceae bacterium CEB3]